LIFRHAIRAHPARLVLLDLPVLLAIPAALEVLADRETMDNQELLDRQDQADHPAHPAVKDREVMEDDRLSARRTVPENREHLEKPALQACPETMGHPEEMASPDHQEQTDHPAHRVPADRTARMDQPDPPANRVHRANVVSVRNTALWMAVCSSRMEREGSK